MHLLLLETGVFISLKQYTYVITRDWGVYAFKFLYIFISNVKNIYALKIKKYIFCYYHQMSLVTGVYYGRIKFFIYLFFVFYCKTKCFNSKYFELK